MSGKRMNAFDLFHDLRRLAVERPGDARKRVGELLDARPQELAALLVLIGAPGEGRLRHIVANVILQNTARFRSASMIEDWYEIETDEFTKGALRRALDAVGRLPRPRKGANAGTRPVDEHFVEAYRYAAGRLTHRLRNALIEPQTLIRRLSRALENLNDPAAQTLMANLEQLTDSFQRVGRIAEFDTEDEHFRLRSIQLHDWVTSMNSAYAQKYSSVALEIIGNEQSKTIRVQASDYLLQEIFWNLWVNAHQAVGEDCRMTVQITSSGRAVHLLIRDNGEGLPHDMQGTAFAHTHAGVKSRPGHSGKGLLEVQDAVGRLRGDIEIVAEQSHCWVKITLPQEEL